MAVSSDEQPEQGVVEGPVPLVPMQRVLLEGFGAAAPAAATWALLELPASLELEVLEQAVCVLPVSVRDI